MKMRNVLSQKDKCFGRVSALFMSSPNKGFQEIAKWRNRFFLLLHFAFHEIPIWRNDEMKKMTKNLCEMTKFRISQAKNGKNIGK